MTFLRARLGDVVACLQRGKSPTYSQHGRVKVINQKCIRWHGIDTQYARFIDDSTVSNVTSARYLSPSDVLVNSTGEGTIGRAAIWNGEIPGKWVADSHVTVIRPGPELDSNWLKYWLESKEGREFVASSKTGATKQTELSSSKLKDCRIPLPHVEEQRRIIARIKECMERVEEIESLRDQASLEAANIELACFHDALIDGMQQKGWPVRTLGDAAKSFRYGTSVKAHTQAIGFPVLRMGNIQGGYLDFSSLKYIDLPDTEANRYKLNVGDILINRTNSLELVGKAATFTSTEGDWLYASYLVRVEVDNTKVLPEFVTAVINSSMGRDYVLRTARRAIGMVNLNAKEMARFPMPLPTLDEQEKVVAQLAVARPLAEELRASMVDPEISYLRLSILQKAFAGEL